MMKPPKYPVGIEEKCLVVGNIRTAIGRLKARGGIYPEGKVLAKNDSDEIVPWNPEGTDGSQKAARILCEEVMIEGGEGDVQIEFYVAGDFNRNEIFWGSATAEQKKAAEWSLSDCGLVLM